MSVTDVNSFAVDELAVLTRETDESRRVREFRTRRRKSVPFQQMHCECGWVRDLREGNGELGRRVDFAKEDVG